MRFIPVSEAGYVNVYAADITARKQAEDALRQFREEVQSLNRELTSANKALSIVNETLEQRVQERTRTLASLNEEVTRANEELRVANEELIEEIRHRVSAEQEARVNTSRIKLLNDVITAGNQADTLQTAMQAMLDAAVDLLEFDGGLLYLHTDPDNVAELRAWRRAPEVLVKQGGRVPITLPNLAPVYRGESWFADAYPDSAQYRGAMEGVRATAIVPLTAGDHVVGHYGIWSMSPHHFAPQERALFEAIGREAGTVIARMQAEEQSHASSLYARSLIEASLDPLVTISAEGKITDVNEATEGATGFSREELIESDFSDYFTEPAAAKAGYKQVFTYGYVRDYPLAIRHKSGSIRDVLYNATLFKNQRGEIQGVFAAARDITKQKQAQDALMGAHEEVRSLNEMLESTNKELMRHSQHLEELIAERTSQLRDAERLAGIGETAAMIGHDLRNPLQGLQYIVDLQKLRFERTPPEKRGADDWTKEEELFDRISEQVFYMDKIVADLQDYARPIAPEPEKVAVSTVINDVLASLPHTDHVQIISDVSNLTVIADPHLMRRVFANLVLNAIQAMPEGGTLTITASRFDDSVAINVHDTGVGIPEEMKGKLFLPLATGKAKGTGLGLAVVKRVVDAHGGTIGFESEEEKGTTFTVKLPAREV
ncbi:MAG: ATP-binding protein [Halobacteriota archaeon]